MRALVVFESMFGNTEDIARAVADGLSVAMAVDLLEVGAAPAVIGEDVDLLVVGGPTHARGMSTPDTRADSARRAGDRLVSRGSGIREWLEALRAGPRKVAAAAFDTRIKGPGLLWGSAAKGTDARLRDLGFRVVAPPESFLVGGPSGPLFDRLVEGEAERARGWGQRLGSGLAAQDGHRIVP